MSDSTLTPVTFNNTVLRDGHQSLAATRMTTEQMLPIAPILDSMGFSALETWGGATIDSGLRFLGEFPFDRLDALKKAAPKTPHMMLLRGQNIVGYTHYADDVVSRFVELSAQHGMNIFRIFDALNDPRNMKCAIDAAKKAGAKAHGTICYTTSPVHNIESFVSMGKELQEMGCDAVVLKDMAGLVPPYITKEIISELKKALEIPVWLHTHDTAGVGASTLLAAIDAGVDAVDVSVTPFANGTGQPDCVRMMALLEGNARAPHYDKAKLMEVRKMLEPIYEELKAFTSHKNEVVDCDTLQYQVPGGMLSNFRTQLKEMGMEDRFHEVLEEIPRVREALGWIPLVTPTSQIVGVQATFNVKFGPWKQISPQAADIALGYYGRTPAPVNPEVQALCAKQAGKEPITCRPADLIKPGMDDLRAALKEKGLPVTDEHAVIYAMFPQQLEALYKPKEEAKPAPAPVATPAPAAAATPVLGENSAHAQVSGDENRKEMTLSINGQTHSVTVERL